MLGFAALWSAARASHDASPGGSPVAIEQRGAPTRTVLVFIDSLSREVATDARHMPFVGRLAREGASFDVEPCRDQLTYLCLRAALTGHDESSLLAIRDNFRPEHEGPPDNLFSALAARGERVSVIGSNDFHPYRRALLTEHPLSKAEETPARVERELARATADSARLLVVSLASGDMAAHAHGVNSREYAEAFGRLDRVVEVIASSLPAETHLVVFGDHGHDALGRHLPGTWQKTWAVYRGPALRRGVHHSLHVTDHRALLGVLLGVPSEPNYRGPELASIFDPRWQQQVLPQGLPALKAQRASAEALPITRWACAAAVFLAGVFACFALARATRSREVAKLAALLLAVAAATGLSYDAIRRVAHDHGDSPERSLVLLVPLALGLAAAFWIGRSRSGLFAGRPWLLRAPACIVAVTWFVLLPTAYYYGARRGVILASLLGLGFIALDLLRQRRVPVERRAPLAVLLAFVALALLSLYPVRQVGPETAQAATWALDAKLYQRAPWLALLVAKAALYALCVAPRAARRPLDSAGAAGLFTASLLIELGSARLPREAYAVLFVALVLGLPFARRRAPSTLFSGGLLLLDHLYGGNPTSIAPIEMILAATAAAMLAWRWLQPGRSHVWFTGVTVTLACYLMLWPSVGFHLAGIDFGFMFQWVPEAQYQRAWQLIALGVVLKLGLPIILVMAVARDCLREPGARLIVALGLTAKTALLAVLIACCAINHPMDSHQATAMLAELALLMFTVSCAVVALPSTRRATEPARSATTVGGQLPFGVAP